MSLPSEVVWIEEDEGDNSAILQMEALSALWPENTIRKISYKHENYITYFNIQNKLQTQHIDNDFHYSSLLFFSISLLE